VPGSRAIRGLEEKPTIHESYIAAKLWLFADLDGVAFEIPDFKELRATALLNWRYNYLSVDEALVRLLEFAGKDHEMVI